MIFGECFVGVRIDDSHAHFLYVDVEVERQAVIVPVVVGIHHYLADDEVESFWADKSGMLRLLAVHALNVVCAV